MPGGVASLGQVAARAGLAGMSDHLAAVLKERSPGLVVIDSFNALHALAHPDGEFRQFLHQLAGRLSQFAVCHLADNAIAITYDRDHRARSRSLAIIKTRASNHDPAMRPFTIGPDGAGSGGTVAQRARRTLSCIPRRAAAGLEAARR